MIGLAIQAHEGPIASLAFSMDGQSVVSGSFDGTVRTLNIDSGDIETAFKSSRWCLSLAALGIAPLAIVGLDDGNVRMWRLGQADRWRSWLCDEGSVLDVIPWASDAVVTAGARGGVKMWRAGGRLLGNFGIGDPQPILCLAGATSSGVVAGGGGDGTVRIWGAATMQEIGRYSHGAAVRSLALLEGGDIVLSAGRDGRVVARDVATLTEVWTCAADVYAVAIIPGGRQVILAGADGRIGLWNLGASKPLRSWTVFPGPVYALAVSPDGRRLACGGDAGRIVLLDVADQDDEAPDSPTVTRGTILRTVDSRYELLREVGRGGMGVVYEGIDRRGDIRVAVKMLRQEVGIDRRDRDRFVRVANICAALRHPHVVEIRDVLQEPDLALVFEFIAGETLEQELQRVGRLTWAEARARLTGVSEALQFAHHEGVIHRDLKPSNILISTEGKAKVMDFGIARAAKETLARTTRIDTSGTLAYMAPEQHLGRGDHRVDVFAFGATLYECLTGEPPFTGPDFLVQKERRTFRPIEETCPNVPPWLVAVVSKSLEPDPEMRYQGMAEIMFALATDRGAAH